MEDGKNVPASPAPQDEVTVKEDSHYDQAQSSNLDSEDQHHDIALDPTHEHHHKSHNHSAFAQKGHEDDVVYTTGTTFEKSNIPDPSPQDQSYLQEKGSHETTDLDEEVGEGEAPAKRPFYRRALRHWRPVLHLTIFLLFTG